MCHDEEIKMSISAIFFDLTTAQKHHNKFGSCSLSSANLTPKVMTVHPSGVSADIHCICNA